MNKCNIGIITPPIAKAGITPLSNLVRLLQDFSDNIYLITGNDGYLYFNNNRYCNVNLIGKVYNINYRFSNLVNFVYSQLMDSYWLIKSPNKTWIFFIMGDILILPMFVAKLFRKNVILVFTGSTLESAKHTNKYIYNIIKLISPINCRLSDSIVLYTPNLVNEYNLVKYKNKINFASEHFIDFNIFTNKIDINNRNYIISYIGRLTEEKGVINFVESIPIILKYTKTVKFTIYGEGNLKDKIMDYLKENNLENFVTIYGWVPHEKLSDYINDIKIIVVPSYTEGLPNIILESMACGTIVLSNKVGSIPCIIEDNKTGFLMETNTPDCIASNVIRILKLKSDRLEIISKNAQNIIKSKYNYSEAVKRFYNVIAKFG